MNIQGEDQLKLDVMKNALRSIGQAFLQVQNYTTYDDGSQRDVFFAHNFSAPISLDIFYNFLHVLVYNSACPAVAVLHISCTFSFYHFHSNTTKYILTIGCFCSLYRKRVPCWWKRPLPKSTVPCLTSSMGLPTSTPRSAPSPSFGVFGEQEVTLVLQMGCTVY